MGISHYGCSTKEEMQLSIDSIFNNQISYHKPNNLDNLNFTQENMSLLGSLAEHQKQQLSCYTVLRNDNVILDGPTKYQLEDSVQLPNILVEDEISDLRRWVSRDFHAATNHAQESKTCVLSASSSSQSSCVTSSRQTSPIDSASVDTMKRKHQMVNLKKNQNQTFGQRTSQYRGVTRFVFICHIIKSVVKHFIYVYNPCSRLGQIYIMILNCALYCEKIWSDTIKFAVMTRTLESFILRTTI